MGTPLLLFERQWLPPLQQFQLRQQQLERRLELVPEPEPVHVPQLPAGRVELPDLPRPVEFQLLPWPWLLLSEPYQPCHKRPD